MYRPPGNFGRRRLESTGILHIDFDYDPGKRQWFTAATSEAQIQAGRQVLRRRPQVFARRTSAQARFGRRSENS